MPDIFDIVDPERLARAIVAQRMPTFKKANWIWQALLNWRGAYAIATPWRTCYINAHWFDHAALRVHELAHFAQMERDGTLAFCVKYLWWGLTRGYWANPYEIEAYAISGDID